MGILGDLVGSAIGAFGGNRSKPRLAPAILTDPTYGQSEFLRQQSQLPGIGNLLGQAEDINNAYYQGNVLKYAPQYQTSLGLMGSHAAKMGAGQVPITVGGKQYSPLDLGITSDDLVRASAPALAGAVKADEAFNPFQMSSQSQLFRPQDLLQRKDAESYFNNSIQNQRNVMKSQHTNPWAAGATGFLKGLGI